MKKGFTLLEALIALALVGIIVILAVPQVLSSFNNKTYVAALQKVYIGVQNATKQLMVDERATSISNTSLFKQDSDTVEDTAGNFVKKYFSVEQDCGKTKTPCFASKYRNLAGNNITSKIATGDIYCAKLVSGASICVTPMTASFARVYVDVNASKRPNVAGRDLFVFYIYDDGVVGEKHANSAKCTSDEQAYGCFNRLKNSGWDMDY